MRFILSLVVFLMLAVMPTTAQTPIEVECGDIIESEFTSGREQHRFHIELNAGDQITVESVSVSTILVSTLSIRDPNENRLTYEYNEVDPILVSSRLPTNGIYEIRHTSKGNAETAVSIYTLFFSCTLRDGTVIEPGEAVVGDNGDTGSPPAPPSRFTGFGFPGVQPVDFSDGIEIPIALGQPQTTPLAGDLVALYTYDATAESTATLSLSRVSGEVAVGVTVINRDDNDILFLGGLPSSNNLSVELTFPSDGTYVIGLFSLDAGQGETSGAIQVTLE